MRARDICLSLVVCWSLVAEAQLRPFRSPNSGLWGYRGADGRVVLAPRYVGAGEFKNGLAPVEDSVGYAIIERDGDVVERIVIDSVRAIAEPVPPPVARCRHRDTTQFPSRGLNCYVEQLQRGSLVLGGFITYVPPGNESFRGARFFKLRFGATFIERVAYEGSIRRLLLPGVGFDKALAWRKILWPDQPEDFDGCAETWQVGPIAGGSYIEQRWGC